VRPLFLIKAAPSIETKRRPMDTTKKPPTKVVHLKIKGSVVVQDCD
jgi:hypothetical protein